MRRDQSVADTMIRQIKELLVEVRRAAKYSGAKRTGAEGFQGISAAATLMRRSPVVVTHFAQMLHAPILQDAEYILLSADCRLYLADVELIKAIEFRSGYRLRHLVHESPLTPLKTPEVLWIGLGCEFFYDGLAEREPGFVDRTLVAFDLPFPLFSA